MRYAIYFTPQRDEPLARLAAEWLGRDAFGGEVRERSGIGQLSGAEIAFHTASPRRYGFHATLKAPFRLAEGQSEAALLAAMDAFCEAREPVVVPRIVLARMDGFFALLPEHPHAGLDMLAADVVTGFEPFRAPLTPAEIARRNPEALSPVQLRNLHGWGYPYIFDQFRFHMTLTGRIGEEEAPRVARAIEEWFGPLLDEPLCVDTLGLFVEPEPGAPFVVHSIRTLGQSLHRKSA
jgi:putative phosphonate metabolism protein